MTQIKILIIAFAKQTASLNTIRLCLELKLGESDKFFFSIVSTLTGNFNQVNTESRKCVPAVLPVDNDRDGERQDVDGQQGAQSAYHLDTGSHMMGHDGTCWDMLGHDTTYWDMMGHDGI